MEQDRGGARVAADWECSVSSDSLVPLACYLSDMYCVHSIDPRHRDLDMYLRDGPAQDGGTRNKIQLPVPALSWFFFVACWKRCRHDVFMCALST